MKATAAIFSGPNTSFELIETPVPALYAGETLVRVECCSLCKSDLNTYLGKRIEPTPTILGHEIIGRVVESLAGLKAGERITWGIAAFCGECYFCKACLPQKCEALFKYGHMKVSNDQPLSGGLATHIVLRKGTPIMVVPGELPIGIAALANCSTATAAAAIRLSELRPGSTAAIFGAGVLGLNACALLNSIGVQTVVFDVNPAAAERAVKFGASQSFCNIEEFQEALMSLTENRGADACLEVSGAKAAAQSSLTAVRIGGTVVWAGTAAPTGDVVIEPNSVVRTMLNLRGLHNYGPQDLKTALQFLAENFERFPFADLIGKSFPLAEVNEAFKCATENSGTRVTVVP